MRKVYEDQDMTMVGYYQTLLEEAGMETAIKNEYAQLATGEIPFTQVYPELWVMDASHYEEAVGIIRSVRDAQSIDASRVRFTHSTMKLSVWRAGCVCLLLFGLAVLYSLIAE